MAATTSMMTIRRLYSTAAINMGSVKALKEKTGLSLAQCHKALQQHNGDPDAAFHHLHKIIKNTEYGAEHANPREGLVGIFGGSAQSEAAIKRRILRLRCRTDFAANSSTFQDLFAKIGNLMIEHDLEESKTPEDVENLLKNLSIQIKEPVLLDSGLLMKAFKPTSIFGQYIHAKLNPQMGRMAALVEVERNNEKEEINKDNITKLANNLACHIVGMKPASIEELLVQQYLFDDTIRIEQLLLENDIQVSKFKCITLDTEK